MRGKTILFALLDLTEMEGNTVMVRNNRSEKSKLNYAQTNEYVLNERTRHTHTEWIKMKKKKNNNNNKKIMDFVCVLLSCLACV